MPANSYAKDSVGSDRSRQHNEQQLLEQVKEGDQQAFTSLYQHYHAGLYHYVLRFVKLPALTEDLVHDVFVKIWEVRRRINPELGFSGYLFRVARNHVYKFIQRASRDKAMWQQLVRQLQKETDSSVQLLETKEYERLFQDALNQLPAQRRRVFVLCRQEGKTYEEVADILGISRNAIKKHMVLSGRFITEYVSRYGSLFLAVYIASRLL